MLKSRFSGMALLAVFGLFILVFAVLAVLISGVLPVASVGASVIIILVLFAIVWIIKGLRVATITTTEITVKNIFGNKRFTESDIEYLYLSGERGGDARLKFRLINQINVTLFGPYYDNIKDFDQLLQAHYAGKIKIRPINEPVIIDPILPGSKVKFAGNPHFTHWGISMYLFLVIAPIALAIRKIEGWELGILCWVMIYLVYGLQLHYFVVTDRFLIIKNHVMPWYSRVIPLQDIKSVGFITPRGRASDGLRIKRRGKLSKFYSAGSLRMRTWQRFKKTMESLNILVEKNDFVYENI